VHLSKPAKVDVLMEQIESFLDQQRGPQSLEPAVARPAIAHGDGSQSTVFVVDDDRGQLDDMANLLREHGRTVETFASGAAFLAVPHPAHAGCLVVDALMPTMGGLELLERLRAEDRDLPAIMITGHGDVAMATQAMKAGAADFLEKPVSINQLLASIERALERGKDAAKRSAWRENATERLARLTPREREIMDLVILGRPNKIIAEDLGISQRTVESHRAAVMKRTGAKSLPDLVRLVMAGG
jgi:two-component system CheB/CheR fusion protein